MKVNMGMIRKWIHRALGRHYARRTRSHPGFMRDEYISLSVGDYDHWYYNRPQARAYLGDSRIWKNQADMIECLNPVRVFEFGSGLGNLLAECSKRGIDIVGSETSEYALRRSICKSSIVRIGEIPKVNLPFPDNSFDLIFSSEVMEHVTEEATVSVIRELSRVCSRHALFTINTFDADQPGHINMHPREWWLKEFEINGFRHNDELCARLNGMKYLQWDIYVLDKTGPHSR